VQHAKRPCAESQRGPKISLFAKLEPLIRFRVFSPESTSELKTLGILTHYGALRIALFAQPTEKPREVKLLALNGVGTERRPDSFCFRGSRIRYRGRYLPTTDPWLVKGFCRSSASYERSAQIFQKVP